MKNRQSFVILLICVLLTQSIEAQIFTGYKITTGNYPTFNLLVESYNDCNQNILSKQLDNFKVLHGSWLAMNIYGFELGYHRSFGSTMAEFINGDKRHFKMTFYYMDFLIDASSWGDRFITIGPIFGGCRGRINIDSYYEYADGRLDISANKFLNGTFKTNYEGYVGIIGGVKVKFNFSDNFSLFLRAERIFPIVAGELLVKNSTHHFNKLEPYLPTDYKHYNSIISSQMRLPSPYRVKSDLKAYNFSFGLQIPINFK